MQLTTADVARFVGGQLEVQNLKEDYLYRGEIAEIVVEGGDLRVKHAWIAKMDDEGEWVSDDNLDYAAGLEIYRASKIGPGAEGGGDRLHLSSWLTGESVTLFPPDGSKLDRSKVKGLDPAPAA